MGNVTSVSGVGKLVLSDGSIHEFNEPLTVAELMLEHPRHVVVELRSSAVTEKRPTPLPADLKLDLKKVYMMLPIRGGKPVSLSSEEIRRVILCANSALRSRSLLLSSSKVLPWLARARSATTPTTTGAVGVDVKKKDLTMIGEEMRWETEMAMAAEGRPEYLSRQLSGKAWKPSLDTIKEKKFEKKLSHWLFKF
ncbi:uncharacterized protein LOC111455974 [Cucurbita moschata]|uniref:Uncharacterized protein LOC111455974 n=1 Tax=Cucurbita moschata TaxID=3662 RepID=A0A6J1GN59_CUCMO|nr:uncharacterized protein LOC111455974 [Cucurbita moschata]